MLAHRIDAERQGIPAQRTLQQYFAEHPLIDKINLAADWLAEILGPTFWAVLIVGFIWAERFPS
jgi:hypothetical protein